MTPGPLSPALPCSVRVAFVLAIACPVASPAAEPLVGTSALNEDRPLDVRMVEGIDRFALSEIERARQQRLTHWDHDYASPQRYRKSVAPNRERFRQLIGAVDPQATAEGIRLLKTTTRDSLVAESESVTVHAVSWPVLEGVTAEGLLLQPNGKPVARVIAIPDASQTPEMIAGIEACDSPFALELASQGCEVLVPTIIDRNDTHSGNPQIGRKTNQTHREFIYRQAFELGRHIIGYEVQKVLAGVDQLTLRNRQTNDDLPIAVVGVSEGGLLAMYSAAVDERVDGVVVSGYFDQRERVWQEPIYRNVWRLLEQFGDAEIASLIAPRRLWIEVSPAIVEVQGPPEQRDGRRGAAPGEIRRPTRESVAVEFNRAKTHWQRLGLPDHIATIGNDGDAPLNRGVIGKIVSQLAGQPVSQSSPPAALVRKSEISAERRMHRQVSQLIDFTQRRLALCHRSRDQRFAAGNRASVADWVESSDKLRDAVYRELIGKLPHATVSPNPRTRQILETAEYTGYQVELDVFPDVIAGGILLLPKDLQPDQRRPVVVCQHGLEGTPMHTISDDPAGGFRAYKAFSAELARRGFIVYAPQNPYRGQDAFRTLQRKSNPLGRSLFSYIIPQHLVTLRWLAALPGVAPDRIAFYGLSYGGKTAVRVPPMLPPSDSDPGYCLSICSADFNEWVAKNASYDARFSYLWTGEYEIFEWNMGHVANYAELAMLMAPRPFMVERGHDDGVGIDEWVAWEYAKVRRHYNKLGIGDRTEIEFFDGPHTINGQGTYDFLHRHLDWPAPAARQ